MRLSTLLSATALVTAAVALRRTTQMAKTLKDWQQVVDDLNTATTTVAGRLDNLKQQVQQALDLQSAGGLSADDQSNIFSEFQSLSDHLKALGSDPANPTPPAPPSAVPPVTSVDGVSTFSDGSAPTTPQPTTTGVTPAGSPSPAAGPDIQAPDHVSTFTTGAAPQPNPPTPAAPATDAAAQPNPAAGQNPADGTTPPSPTNP